MQKYSFLALAAVLVLAGCGAKDAVDKAAEVTGDAAGAVVDTAADAAKATGDMAGDAMEATGDAAMDAAKVVSDSGEAAYTLTEVAAHGTQEDCWTVIDGTVADVTQFFGVHPGGDDALRESCGRDATKDFKSVKEHSPDGYKALMNMKIGVLTQ